MKIVILFIQNKLKIQISFSIVTSTNIRRHEIYFDIYPDTAINKTTSYISSMYDTHRKTQVFTFLLHITINIL